MDEYAEVTIQCDWCNGSGHYADSPPGFRVMCQKCSGRGTVEYMPNCDHMESMWDGYGLIGDSQWDGAQQCGDCEALFTLWPKEIW